MKINKKTILLLISIFIVFVPIYAQEQAIPELKSRVTDLTGTLMQNEISVLEQKLTLFEEANGSQIVVLMIYTTDSESIEEYSMRVAEKWKIGRKDIDDGVILLIAKSDRKLRIEVGYGLESTISDAYAQKIIDDFIVPQFKNGYFYKGVYAGVDEIIKLISGNSSIPKSKTVELEYYSKKLRSSGGNIFYISILISLVFIGSWFLSNFRKRKLLFILYLFLLVCLSILCSILFNSWGALCGFFVYLLIVSLMVIRNGKKNSKGSNSSGNKSSSFFGGSNFDNNNFGGGGFDDGGSFGGGNDFDGGGGCFGGGGASGDW